MYQGRCRASIKQAESLGKKKGLNKLDYVSRGFEKTQKSSIERACIKRYRETIETAIEIVSNNTET